MNFNTCKDIICKLQISSYWMNSSTDLYYALRMFYLLAMINHIIPHDHNFLT